MMTTSRDEKRINAHSSLDSKNQLDPFGFRPNVGIVVCNQKKELLFCRRYSHLSWQFPQGGIEAGETAIEAMYRELYEELGLEKAHVKRLAQTHEWLYYRLPQQFLRRTASGAAERFVGQKQKWFLLYLLAQDDAICLDQQAQGHRAEFDAWQWVRYWYPLREIVPFKRTVYAKMLNEFFPILQAL